MTPDPTTNGPVAAAEPTPPRHEAAGPAPTRDARWHWTVLAATLALLTAGLVVDVDARGDISLPGLQSVPLPVICPLRRYFGIPCPTCGMTRSVVHLVQGRPADSFAAHRLGWLALAVVVFQVPYRAWCLSGRREIPDHPRLIEFALLSALLLLVVNWLLPS